MEIVAMDMKLRGMYVARQLSFQGVTFKVERVPLTDDFIRMYNESVALVSTKLCCCTTYLAINIHTPFLQWNLALKSFQNASYLMNVDANTMKIVFGQFWGAHQVSFCYLYLWIIFFIFLFQRFFKYLAIAAKVDYAVCLTVHHSVFSLILISHFTSRVSQVKITKEAVESGKCVVIGLQSTGEARTLDEVTKCDGELEDYISTAK